MAALGVDSSELEACLRPRLRWSVHHEDFHDSKACLAHIGYSRPHEPRIEQGEEDYVISYLHRLLEECSELTPRRICDDPIESPRERLSQEVATKVDLAPDLVSMSCDLVIERTLAFARVADVPGGPKVIYDPLGKRSRRVHSVVSASRGQRTRTSGW